MKLRFFCHWLILLCAGFNANSQKINDIELVDISTKQIRLMNKYGDSPIKIRNRIMIDSIYEPYKNLWKGYLGNENDFKEWLNDVAFNEIEYFNQKAKKINLKELNGCFWETVISMRKFTGNKPKGKWYIFFGPKWTNLGGFSDGTMLVDLAHPSNKSLDDIKNVFPHEINHQIYSSKIQPNNNAVLYRIINEGLACYVSYLFHEKKTSKAKELGYTKTEFEYSIENENEIMELLSENHQSNDSQLSENFANRAFNFKDEYPGAIGYFIGFRIVEEYVRQNGKNSWKYIYKTSPSKVLKESRLLH